MAPRSRSTVGVYERPHPLRTRKVLGAVVALGYALWFYLR